MEFSLLTLLSVLLVAAIGGAISNRLGYPALMGELVAGIVFGPMLLGLIPESAGLDLLAEVGVFLMMLYIGIEVDHRDMMKASWPGIMAAAGGFVIPFVCGYWLVSEFYGYNKVAGLFIGLAMGVTSLATKSRALMELKLLGTRVANVMLAGALACDTLALVVFAGITGYAESASTDIKHLALVFTKAAVFFGLAVVIGLRVFPLIGRLLRRFGFTERTMNFTMVILVGLVFAEMAEIAGLHSVIGAFIAGLFIREEVLKRKLSHEVSGMVHDVSIGFLAPVFFVTAGFKVDISVLWTDTIFLSVIVLVALVSKMIGTLLFCLPTRMSWRESVVIGAGMNGRGAVEIIIAEIGLQMGLIDQSMFSILVFMAFITTAFEPFFLKRGAAWLRRHGALVRSDDARETKLIAGASPLARLLARELAISEKVVLIDNNQNLCEAAKAEGLNAIKGNVLNEDFLDVAGASNARVFIAMTTNHEVNRVASGYARDVFGIPLVWSWPAAPVSSGTTAGDTGAGEPSLLSPSARWNEWIMRKEVERVVFVAEQHESITDFQVWVDRRGLLPLVIERGGRRLAAMTAGELLKGDTVIGLRRHSMPEYQADLFEELIRHCPIIDVPGKAGFSEMYEVAADALAPLVGLDAAEIAAKLVKREQESSTVVAPGVAIPHVIIDGDQPVALLIARCREGANFPGSGTPPVEFVFVIIGARSARNLHLRVLSAIAQLFQDPAFEDIMLAAKDTEAMRKIMLGTRRRRF
ncbi:MAG TPA: cation:proton antiporter [Kiritimatiellia bacterium]|nr:cation:proton antiporter [Kiritimatiellia bacterium]HMP34330.1 cation:proton antiporter [Kiritimatiellia bacterium]